MEKLVKELAKVNIIIDDIYDLVNTKEKYPMAIPILLSFLKDESIEDDNIKEGIIRSLAVKEAKGIATTILIDEYNKIPKEKTLLRWAIGNTIDQTITPNDTDIEKILQIIQNKENGTSRQMFVLALGKIKTEKVEEVLIHLLDDEDVVGQALSALGKLKSKKAEEKIIILKNHKNKTIQKEAEKALNKILKS